MRITSNRATSEELTLDVFYDVWRRASSYDPEGGPVIGWIMNQARSRAIDRLRFDQRKKRVNDHADGPLPVTASRGPDEAFDAQRAGPALARGLEGTLSARATGYRNRIFLRDDVCRSSSTIESTPRNREDTNPLRIGSTPTGAHRRIEGPMSSESSHHDRDRLESVFLYALQVLPSSERLLVEAHISACADCRHELETLRPVIGAFTSWPTDVLRPSASLWERLAQRIAAETGEAPGISAPRRLAEPEWEEAAPGISCKLLATDTEKHRVSMLVRLAPGAEYPPHRHAGIEELYLLHGELTIDDKKLYPGDYNRAEPGTADQRIWSETGCTCVLLTSTRDVLR